MGTIETAWRDLTAALEGEVVLPGSRTSPIGTYPTSTAPTGAATSSVSGA